MGNPPQCGRVVYAASNGQAKESRAWNRDEAGRKEARQQESRELSASKYAGL